MNFDKTINNTMLSISTSYNIKRCKTWSEMIQEYQRVIDDTENPYRIFKAEAQFSIAEAYRIHGVEIFGTVEKAKDESLQVYQQVIDNYPWRECTEWREKAQERIIELKKQ